MRALEAVAREGERLGVHLVAASGTGGRTAETEPARRATLRVTLDAPSGGRGTGPAERGAEGEPAPGRGVLAYPDGRVTGVQGGRVTGRIPRTATQRPTVLPLDWQRMGDPRPGARCASWATAPPTWPCWRARWSGRPGRCRPVRCPRCCDRRGTGVSGARRACPDDHEPVTMRGRTLRVLLPHRVGPAYTGAHKQSSGVQRRTTNGEVMRKPSDTIRGHRAGTALAALLAGALTLTACSGGDGGKKDGEEGAAVPPARP